MSVSFQGVGDATLDLNNGLATRILRAMGYGVGFDSDGSMPLVRAREGLARAKESLVEDDLKYLHYLEELVQEIEDAGGNTLAWF